VRLEVLRASSSLFTMLGARPLMGRLFAEDDDVSGPPRVAILSCGLWTTQFGSDPGILGRSLILDADQVTVVGVLRPEFFINGEVIPTVGAIEKMDLHIPLPDAADTWERRGDENYNIIVRLKKDATWAGARADVDIATRIREQDRRHWTFGMAVMALGAAKRTTLGMVLRQGLVLAIAGTSRGWPACRS